LSTRVFQKEIAIMQKITWTIFLAAVFMASIFLGGCAPAPTPEPTPTPAPPTPTSPPEPTATPELTTSEAFTTAAWQAYLRKDFAEAIELSQECIRRWEAEAIEQQAALDKAPPIGTVTNEQKDTVFSYASLNDVGTSYYIIAISMEELGKIDEAKAAYAAVIELPYARCWDPQGWFWSPAQVAKQNLAKLP
jgi:hypothetical protein